MKKIMMIVAMAAAFVLPTMAQNNQEQLNVQFQSTSTLQGSGSVLSSQPMLNADGTAYNPTEASTPTKAGKPGQPKTVGPTTPTIDPSPLGDAVLPLLLMAMAYAVYSVARVYRRKRRA